MKVTIETDSKSLAIDLILFSKTIEDRDTFDEEAIAIIGRYKYWLDTMLDMLTADEYELFIPILESSLAAARMNLEAYRRRFGQ